MCLNCKTTFGSKKRKTRTKKLWKEYSRKKQTYAQLSNKYGLSVPTIQNELDKYDLEKYVVKPRKVMIVMDTVYFRRSFGVMVFRDWYEKENLSWRFVVYETIAQYKDGVEGLKKKGFTIEGIVADGRRGIFQAFGDTPVQMCHFHQTKIVQRYISLNPRLEAGIELEEIVNKLTRTDYQSFAYWLRTWFTKWQKFLNEKTINSETGKSHYTHRKLRSAYNSLKSNSKHLYTYLDKELYPKMPNTTNSLEGTFGHLKSKIRLHSRLKLERKKRLIDELLRKNVT